MIFKGLQNDHKAVMVEIEEALHKLHATARVGGGKDETKMEATGQTVSLSSPFALVDAVTQGSPAFQAVSLCPHQPFLTFWLVEVNLKLKHTLFA